MYLHSIDDGDDHEEKKINNMWDKLLIWVSAVFNIIIPSHNHTVHVYVNSWCFTIIMMLQTRNMSLS